MAIQVNKYLTSPLLEQVQDNQAELLTGQKYTYRSRTYHVQMIETLFNGEEVLIILAQSADRLFGDVYHADKSSKRIRNAHEHLFPQMDSIIKGMQKDASEGEVHYTGAMTDELQAVVDLFKPAKPDPDLPSNEWTRNQKALALFVVAIAITGIGVGVRKGAISVPSRKAIADFMTQSKESFYAFIAKWRNTQTPPLAAKV
ncbi:MAG: hypothetical protein KDK64_08350 [Chlamydiia bacterium]|nr:hypothetical protein [Chlamydiia bacterium]